MRWFVGVLLGWIARLWLATLRIAVVEVGPLPQGPAPWCLAFFHGTQFPLLAWKRRRATTVMVSLSRDGDLQSGALGTLGLDVVRGSSSRGALAAARRIVRRLRGAERDVAFAVDGPRGPRGQAKGGVCLVARTVGGVIVPMGSAASHSFVFRRAWDRFVLPWPFARVVLTLGPALEASASPEHVTEAIARANGLAEGRIQGAGALCATAAP
jgi:lysophospholipid acyltransferase (LPLAT)-like uncharacterized protein